MRIFVGIDIPDDIKKAIDIESDKFLKYCESYKKVGQDNYHVTLKFMGELSVSDLEDLEDILRDKIKGFKAFDVHLKDLGFF
jgi:2'-5' RNA ligase